MFAFIPCEIMKVSQDDQIQYKHDSEAVSWWMEQN